MFVRCVSDFLRNRAIELTSRIAGQIQLRELQKYLHVNAEQIQRPIG